jgi:F-type H+-transporting ATPase subunit a
MAVEEHHHDGEMEGEPDTAAPGGRPAERLDAVEDQIEQRVQPTTA